MRAFNCSLLKQRLENLDPPYRAIFALSCAERLMPLYEVFCDKSGHGHWEYLRSTLDRLWDQLQQGTMTYENEFLKRYESFVPGDSMLCSERTLLDPLAENAVLALASACETVASGESEKAVWAAGQAYEAVDYMAHNLGEIDFDEPDAESSILRNPLVQTELGRQLDDLTKLEQHYVNGKELNDLVKLFREQASSGADELRANAGTLSSQDAQ